MYIFIIFLLALGLRFLYFPGNIYFGFDQARDGFAALEILSGHLKVLGPPTTIEGLYHGVLYYYIYAPIYLLSSGDPTLVTAFLRILNAIGVFLIFLISSRLFNKAVGLISAYLFAISFEQTQFALYFNHPSLAVFSVMVMFLGLGLLIFKQQSKGLIIAFLGLGLSIQFEFILTYLLIPFSTTLFLFQKNIKVNLKIIILSLLVFLATISSFIISEIKFGTIFQNLPNLLLGEGRSVSNIIEGYLFGMSQLIRFNFGTGEFIPLFFLLLGVYIKLLFSKFKRQMIFLGLWFFSVFIIYVVNGGGDIASGVVQYHPNVGISPALLIFTAFLIYYLSLKSLVFSFLILVLITILNLNMIIKFNPTGSIPEINAQSFMLLSDEKKVLDFIYEDAKGEPMAVKAITMPFYINTTWSYLFEWIGKQKYGYLPVWGGKNALGFPGNLKVEEAQSKLPVKRYLIIEPARGIPLHLIDNYLREESYFSNIIEEKEIGKFKIQVRINK